MKPAALWGFAAGAILGYLATAFVPAVPLLRFHPLSGAWTFQVLGDEPSITWFGRLLVAAIAGALGAGIAPAILRRPPWAALAALATLAVLLLAWNEREWFMK